MNATHNLRLPASESAKLAPARSRHDVHEQPVAGPAPQPAEIVSARAVTRRPIHHLSGFARS
jgi:hypothetical protein